jgi:outer membrane lipoprotein-sorting protein
MTSPEDDKWFDEALTDAIASKETRTDFEQWKLQHPQAVEMLTSRASQKASASTSPLTARRIIMKSPLKELAAAAVIIVTVVTAYYAIGRIDITTPVFGDVIEQIQKARSVTYKHTFFPGESWESTTTEMIIESGIMRSERPNGDIVISDPGIGKSLHLMPNSKRAILTQRASKPGEKRPFNYFVWISTVHEDGYEFTGQKDVNGKMTNVFTASFDKTSVWVDPDTNLPVRVETIIRPNPIVVPEIYVTLKDFGGEDDAARSMTVSRLRDSNRIRSELKTVMSDFVWNEELDESLFNLEPPEEYTVEERQFDTNKTRRDSLFQALAFWAEMSDGMFPLEIDDLSDPNMIRPMLMEKFDKDGDPAEELDQALKQLDIMLKGLTFTQFIRRKVDRDWHYAGDGVKLGDAEKAIFWFRSNDPEIYRVLYGDLSFKKVAPENLPK